MNAPVLQRPSLSSHGVEIRTRERTSVRAFAR
jgi:hypothetical protein